MNTRSLLAPASLAAAACLWGTGFLFGKLAFAEMTVAENVTLRFVCGTLVLLPILVARRTRLARGDFGVLLLASVVGVPVQFLVQFKGLELTTVSHASLMVGTLPVLLALSSALFLRERLTRVEWRVLFLSAVGAVLIAIPAAGAGNGPEPSATGDLLVLVSMLAAVVMILSTKRLMQAHDPLYITAAMIAIGTVLLLVWLVASQPIRFHFSASAWTAVAAQGVLATAMAFLLWNWGLARVPASRAGVFLNMEPLVGTILGVLLLRESLGDLTIVGGMMILGAAAYFSTRRNS